MVFRLADHRKAGTLATEFRRRRLAFFWDALQVNETTRILDIGGTLDFWRNLAVRGKITVLNVGPPPNDAVPGCEYVQGDARDLSQYGDGEFDVAFSNSVIEHLDSRRDQDAMAINVRRVCQRYFVQTPNRHFIVEPHFVFPCFQFFPPFVRTMIARYWPYGWYEPGSAQPLREALSLRLLSCAQIAELFPDAVIIGERFLGLNKSLMAIRTSTAFSTPPGLKVLREPAHRRLKEV
jgi:hypothetical protein